MERGDGCNALPSPPRRERENGIRGTGAQSRALTHSSKYVINRLQIMSRIHAKTDAFRAIADPTRRAILDRLRAGPANAGTLAADFQSSRPAVSKHLKVLR
jgi:hypothetical protein